MDAMNSCKIQFKKNKHSLKLYKLYSNRWIVYLFRIIVGLHIIFLPFIEHPAVFTTVPFWIPNLIEFIFLLIYLIRWFHLMMFQERKEFLKSKSNITLPVFVLVRKIFFLFAIN
jgi:hypothetical protein